MITTQSTLTERWDQFKIEFPKKRIREAAISLGVSEAELLATELGSGVIKLQGDFSELYKELPSLGRVMSLTRNEECILEHKGEFENISIQGDKHKVGTLIGSIEARAFFNLWKFAFAGEVKSPKGALKNLQFFDAAGNAITKIYLLDDDKLDAYNKLVSKYRASDHNQLIEIVAEAPTVYEENIDEQSFLSDWRNLKDTHDFFMLLRKYKVNRLRALQIAENTFSRKIDSLKLNDVLEIAAKETLPIMIFVGSKGNIQIHQDLVHTIRLVDNWLNVLDPNFNMHLNMNEITDTWVVTKPTEDGDVTSIECFNKNRELIVQFFGLRKPGQPELEKWRFLVQFL